MANNQLRGPQILGFPTIGPGNSSATLALSAANTWLAYSFVPDQSKTLNAIRAFASLINGSLATTDITCDLYSDIGGFPGASLESRNTITSPLAAGTWGEWTGFTTALTAGTRYWLVFKNVNGVPGTNFPTFRHGGNDTWSRFGMGTSGAWGWAKRHSTDGGVSWAGTTQTATFGWRLQYSDGTYDGMPASNTASATAAANGVYSAREWGAIFTSPASAVLNIRGIGMMLGKVGAPSGNARYRLYTGATPTLIDTTASIPNGSITNGNLYVAYFPATHAVAPGTVVRLMLGETAQADTSSNTLGGYELTIDNDANSRALLPLEGTMWKTYFDGSTWTDTNTILPSGVTALLDTDGEFAASASACAGDEGLLMIPTQAWW